MRLSTPRKGYDNTAELDLGTVRSQGFSFAMRYLSRYTSKVVTSQEAADNRRNGISLGLVFEDEAARATAGWSVGQADAQFSRAQAQARGISPRVIYLAVDFDVAGNPGVVDSYFDGAASVLGKGGCGPYGGIEVVSHLMNRGFQYGWQTYAWSRGQLDGRAQVYQYLNTNSFDYNHAYFDDFGQVDGKPAGPWRPDYSKFDQNPIAYNGKHLLEAKTLQQHYGAMDHPVFYHQWLAELSHRLVYLRKRVWFEAHKDESPVGFGSGNPLPTWGSFNRGYRWKELLRATDPVSFRRLFPHDPHGAPLPRK